MIERETWTWGQADNLNSYIRIEKWGGGPPEFLFTWRVHCLFVHCNQHQ